MVQSTIRIVACAFSMLSMTMLQAAAPDISNLSSCISEVRKAAKHPAEVLTFDAYATDYSRLISDLQSAKSALPHVYQEAAVKPFLQFLHHMGENRFYEIFSGQPSDQETANLQAIIPDAALAILSCKAKSTLAINAFEEVVSDLYNAFLSEEARVSKQSGNPIPPPDYGSIPPLVKFGNSDAGPYTWTGDATYDMLGMGCGVVSLPPEQVKGGLLAWSALGHETGGHDVTHADKGLLDELASTVHKAVLQKFKSKGLADYWARCIDETSADVCGYLNMGPSLGISLIGYFRALGDGKLRSIGSSTDPHPIDLLRGYLAAAVVKRLDFQDARIWSQTIAKETSKDNAKLLFADDEGNLSPFPVSFATAVASTEVVAEVIMRSKLKTLHSHSFQELEDWTDTDQAIVDNLVTVMQIKGELPASLQGPGFNASYVVAAATTAALQKGADVPTLFKGMQDFLATMHSENPTWSHTATEESIAFLNRNMPSLVAAR